MKLCQAAISVIDGPTEDGAGNAELFDDNFTRRKRVKFHLQ